MEQEKPTTPVFSIADEIQRRQKEADERRATWEQKRQRATDLYRDGQNPILAFIDTMKPQQDTDRIKRAEKAACCSPCCWPISARRRNCWYSRFWLL